MTDLAGILDILMFLTLIIALMMGYPVAFTLAGVALAFGLIGLGLGLFQPSYFAALPQRVFGTMNNATLTAVPLFVLMGVILERSKIAEDLLSTMGDLFGRLRGGLLYSTTLAGALVPGLVLVGLFLVYQALVAWLRPHAAPAGEGAYPGVARVVQALVAPLVLILAVLGSILAGIATPTEGAAVGAAGAALLAGWRLERDAGRARGGLARLILLGGAALVALVVIRLTVNTPALTGQAGGLSTLVTAVCVLLAAGGFAGVIGGLVALHRTKGLMPSLRSAMDITAMVFVILIGAALFTLVFRGLGGDEWVASMLEAVPGGLTGALLFTFLVMFLLGFFLDFIEICFVVVPLVAVPLIVMGADPVWLGVMMALVLQTSFLTPPFGFALFYLRGVAPPEVGTLQIYRGVVPFIGLQLLAVAIVWMMPQLATWLPGLLYQ